MSEVTLESVVSMQTQINAAIQRLQQAAQTRTISIPAATITLQPGEHYAGAVLDEDGNHQHHLVLMAARPDKKLNWQDACDWAESIGGDLPDRQEQSLLYANGYRRPCAGLVRCIPHPDRRRPSGWEPE